jgi:1-phosphatidylinositol phosphodiesterase
MSLLPDAMPLNQMSIPGTHDTMTDGLASNPFVAPVAQTQDLGLAQQLNDGIRFLDIRCGPIYNNGNLVANDFGLYHDVLHIGSESFATDVLGVCESFLAAHPTETIVMSIKNDFPGTAVVPKLSDDQFDSTFHNVWQNSQSHWYIGNTVPSLGNVRGEIVLLRRFAQGSNDVGQGPGIDATGWQDNQADFSLGLNFPGNVQGDLRIQDQYVPGNLVSDKITAVQNMLQNALADTAALQGNSNWYVNFTSATSGVPFFPKDWAAGVNAWLSSDLAKIHGGRIGTVVMDFPNDRIHLIGDIIGANWPLVTLSSSQTRYGGTLTVTVQALEWHQKVSFNGDTNVVTFGAVSEKLAIAGDGVFYDDYTTTVTAGGVGATPVFAEIDRQPLPTPYPMLSVQADHTSVAVAPSVRTPVYGQAVRFTATVSNHSIRGVVATGSVQFVIDKHDFGAPVALNASGQAVSPAISSLTAGPHDVEVIYIGNANFRGSRGDVDLAVLPATTSVGLVSFHDAATYGQAVTLTARVRNNSHTHFIPTGMIQFVVDGSNFGTPVTLDRAGRASTTVQFLSVGSHTVAVVYLNSDGNFRKANHAPVTLQVQQPHTKTKHAIGAVHASAANLRRLAGFGPDAPALMPKSWFKEQPGGD